MAARRPTTSITWAPLARAASRAPAEHRRPDRGRVLRARVVVGDHDDVRDGRRSRTHHRALVTVPVAPGAEHHDEWFRVLPQRIQGGGHGVGAVRVVDHGQWLAGSAVRVVGADPFHPAGHRPGAGEGDRRASGTEAGLDQHGQGEHPVRHVEVTG